MPEADGAAHRITFQLPDGQERTVEAGGDEYVLAAARRAGLTLPSRCEMGWDLACAVRVVAGKLDHRDARRYYDADEKEGFALVCRARACSDLRLRTHQARAMRDFRRANHLPAPHGV